MGYQYFRTATGMEAFAAETLALLGRVICADGVSMYLHDETRARVELGSRGIPSAFRAAFGPHATEWAELLTPLNQYSGGLFSVRDATCREPASTVRLVELLQAFDILDLAEMIFVHADEVIGGITLVWTGRAQRTLDEEWGIARDLQRYIQFNFLSAWHGAPVGRRRRITRELRLTPREAQLVESLCAGQTNAELARQLNITVATVKSHLLHIFNKLGVDNRAALIQKALRTPGHHCLPSESNSPFPRRTPDRVGRTIP